MATRSLTAVEQGVLRKKGGWPLTTLIITVALVNLGCKRLSDAWTVICKFKAIISIVSIWKFFSQDQFIFNSFSKTNVIRKDSNSYHISVVDRVGQDDAPAEINSTRLWGNVEIIVGVLCYDSVCNSVLKFKYTQFHVKFNWSGYWDFRESC